MQYFSFVFLHCDISTLSKGSENFFHLYILPLVQPPKGYMCQSFCVQNNKSYQEEMARKPVHQKCFCPPFFQSRQISSYLSKHCDLVSCSATSRPVLILSVSDSGVLTAFGCGSVGWERGRDGEREEERERPLVRKAITCSLKEQMESFCASFPPFPLPSAYLNDMSSPNIQLLS